MISERDLRLAKAIVDPYIGQDIIATAVLGTKLGSMLNENASSTVTAMEPVPMTMSNSIRSAQRLAMHHQAAWRYRFDKQWAFYREADASRPRDI